MRYKHLLRRLHIICIVGMALSDFDCRRQGMTCREGTCPGETRVCSGCGSKSPPREGYDCGLVSEQVGQGSCAGADADMCENGGTCYNGGGASTSCYCPENYYGTKCVQRRIEAASNAERMVINVNPFPGFEGLIYISGHADNTSCLFLPVPTPAVEADDVPDEWMGYYGTFAHSGDPCGDAWSNSTTKSRQFTIQYKQNYLTGLDLLVTIATVLDLDGVDISTTSFSVMADELLQGREVISSRFNPVTLVVTTLDGAEVIDDQVAVGVVIIFTFSVPDSDFPALRLQSLVVNNSLSGDAGDSVTLLSGGCLDYSQMFAVIARPGPPNPGVKSTIAFKLRSFKFTNSDRISLRFVVKVCIVYSDCDLPECSGNARERRSLDEDETEISRTIRILDPHPVSEHLPDGESDPRVVFTAMVTTEGVVLATLTISLIVLITCLCRRGKRSMHEHTQTEHHQCYGRHHLRTISNDRCQFVR